MTVVLPIEWIPSKEALVSFDGSFVVPANHRGSNSHPRLAELFIQKNKEHEIALGHPDSLQDLFLRLSDFYAPGTSVGLFYTHALKDKQIDVDRVVEVLYLYNFYPHAVTPLISMFDSLKTSLITGFESNYFLPDHVSISKFLETREWFLDENFSPPIDFTWNVSQYWDRESIVVTLREVNGDIKRIVDLLAAGAEPDMVKSQILGDAGAVPQSWLDLILGARDDSDDKKTNV